MKPRELRPLTPEEQAKYQYLLEEKNRIIDNYKEYRLQRYMELIGNINKELDKYSVKATQ